MKKKWKYGIPASALTAGVVAIILLLNVFVTVLVGKFPLKFDLTSQKLYEITDTTYEYLKTYHTPTTIYLLSGGAGTGTNAPADTYIVNVLEKYDKASSSIQLEIVDMKSNPTFGQKYLSGNEQFSSNTVIVDGGNKFRVYKQAELYDTSSNILGLNVEQKITSALKYVSSENVRKAYFVQGHNEVEMAAGQQRLHDDNYETAEINLLNEDIPQEAALLVVFNPSIDFTLAEIAKLDAYLANGGKAQFFFYMSVSGLTNLYDYLKQWGIQVNDDAVMETDRQNMIASGGVPMLIPSYAENDITASFVQSKRMTAYLPFAKSLTMLFDSYDALTVTQILKTAQSSYTTTDIESMEKTADSRTGDMTIAALSQNARTNGSVFVSGTPLLLEQDEEYLTSFGMANSDLYASITGFAIGDDSGHIVPAKSFAGDALAMTAVDVLVTLIIIVLLPIAALTVGIIIWFRRRHL